MKVKKGKMEEYLELCTELGAEVRKEEGCIMYTYTKEISSCIKTQQEPDPDTILLFEQWESMQALEAHMKAPHMAEYGKKMADLRESVEIRVSEPVAL